jgi:hypothetical protein
LISAEHRPSAERGREKALPAFLADRNISAAIEIMLDQ